MGEEDTHGRTGAPLRTSPAMIRLMVLSLLGFSGFCFTLSSLPLWAVGEGVPTGAAGLVTTVMLASTVLVQSLVPTAVHRFGLAAVFVVGLVALGLPAPFLPLSSQLWWLLGLSAVRGAGFAVLTVLGSTITARISPPGRRGEAIGLYGLAVAAPNLFGVPLGAALAAAGHFGWAALLAGAPLLGIPLVRALVRDVPASAADLAGEHLHSSRTAVRAVAPPATVLLAVTFAGGGLLTFLSITDIASAAAAVGLLLFGAAGAVSRWGVGLAADRAGMRLLLPGSVLCAVLGMVLVGTGLTAPGGVREAVVLGGATLLGVGYGATQNLTLLAALRRTSHDSVASAVWNIGFDSGTGLGAFGLGAIAAAGTGLPWAFVVVGVLVVPVLVLTRDADRGAPAARLS